MKRIIQMGIISFLFFSKMVFADELSDKLREDLNSSLQDHSAPGAVMLVANDKIGVLTFAAGDSDIATHTPMKVTDTFRIASMSKTFLAAAILKLVDEKKINLDDLAQKYLPNSVSIAKIPNGKEVTVRQLLQMRSGIPDYYLGDNYKALFAKNKNYIVKPAEAIAAVYGEKPLFSAGKKYHYSNTNYVLLQLILENVTQRSLAEAMNQLIIQPLHLTRTYVTEEKDFADSNFKRLTTHGYSYDDDSRFVDVTRKYDGNGLGDGAVVTDITDLYHFLRALLQDKSILNADTLKQMMNFIDTYGLGIYVERVGGDNYYTHNGCASGYSGQYWVDDENDWVIILTNSDETQFLNELGDKVYQNF